MGEIILLKWYVEIKKQKKMSNRGRIDWNCANQLIISSVNNIDIISLNRNTINPCLNIVLKD